MKQPHLVDLYVRGRTQTFTETVEGDDGSPVEQSVSVWVQKLNTPRVKKAQRAGDAARAQVLAGAHDPGSDLHAVLRHKVSEATREELIAELIARDLLNVRRSAEEEIRADEEWSENNYLVGLLDAWEGVDGAEGLSARWIEDPDDVEAARVFDALKRYTEQINERVEAERVMLAIPFEPQPDEVLQEQAFENAVRLAGEDAWFDAFQRSEIFEATRQCSRRRLDDGRWDHTPCDHSKPYFATVRELDDLADETFLVLNQTLLELTVDPISGKDSRVSRSSSEPSDSPEQPETADSSGQPAATA